MTDVINLLNSGKSEHFVGALSSLFRFEERVRTENSSTEVVDRESATVAKCRPRLRRLT